MEFYALLYNNVVLHYNLTSWPKLIARGCHSSGGSYPCPCWILDRFFKSVGSNWWNSIWNAYNERKTTPYFYRKI